MLLSLIEWPPDERTTIGAKPELLHGFTVRTGLVIPKELSDWLGVVNGARIGPGGVFGIRPDDPYCDIESTLNVYPTWRTNGWIPVASDGCGNYYLAGAENGATPVYFNETVCDDRTLTYVVSSGIWEFLWFLFTEDLGDSGWPFSREYVLKHDPAIVQCKAAPMPWDA